MSSVSLITTLHDLKGWCLNPLTDVSHLLSEIYGKLFVVATQITGRRVIEALEQNGWIIVFPMSKIGVEHITDSRRRALRASLESCTHSHLVDMDRILFWAMNYPEELKTEVLNIPNHDFTIFGRTKRALNTHPRNQIDTENIANHVSSLILGKYYDITAASRGISHSAAKVILNNSVGRYFDSDSEWPIILHKNGFKLYYREVEGLEWETRLKRQTIDGANQGQDLKDYYERSSESWVYRLMLAYRISKAAQLTSQNLSRAQRVS